MRKLVIAAASLAAVAIVGLGYVYAVHGPYGLHALLRRGMVYWSPIDKDDPRLSSAVRLALSGAAGAPGETTWTNRAPGFETGETPILVEGKEADRLLLARIDPKLWRFSAHNDLTGDRHLADWMRDLGAALVVNGSYFDHKGQPDTPFRSEGADLGPADYKGTHGAFVASEAGARIADLKDEDWRKTFENAQNAMVSYPLLLDEKGETRATPSQWLANRTFVAQDSAGRIVIGTTQEAFLSLYELARVLREAHLNLVRALNLDGGPVSCQGITVGDYRRNHCGEMEIQAKDGQVRWLRPLTPGADMWGLPVVLAVRPR